MGKRFAQRETKCSLICLRTPRKRSDRPLRAFQMSDISLSAISRTGLHPIPTKLTSDVSRPLGAMSETAAGPFPIPYHMKQTFSHITIKLFDLNPIL